MNDHERKFAWYNRLDNLDPYTLKLYAFLFENNLGKNIYEEPT